MKLQIEAMMGSIEIRGTVREAEVVGEPVAIRIVHGATVNESLDAHHPWRAAAEAALLGIIGGNVKPSREDLAEALTEMQQTDVSDARQLAKTILDNRQHSVTGTEAERIAFLLTTMERNARLARALLAKMGK